MMHRLHKFLLFHALACLGGNVLGSEIIHGEEPPDKTMLYMVSLQNRKTHVCGGFLVSEDFVVTAAHCNVHKDTAVVLGTHDLQTVRKNVKYITKVCRHPSYMKNNIMNDIMLLKVHGNGPITVKEVPLPTSEINMKDDEKCHVAGWGVTEAGGAFVDKLRVVDVSIINQQVCRTQLPRLPARVICAGGYKTDKGFCKGDYGGPLLCNGVAVGVAAFIKDGNCTYPSVPNVYTDISKFLPWINDAIKKKDC